MACHIGRLFRPVNCHFEGIAPPLFIGLVGVLSLFPLPTSQHGSPPSRLPVREFVDVATTFPDHNTRLTDSDRELTHQLQQFIR